MSKIPNRLWCAPPRPINPNAEQERRERENDPALIDTVRNYKQSAEVVKELRKYEHHLLEGMLP